MFCFFNLKLHFMVAWHSTSIQPLNAQHNLRLLLYLALVRSAWRRYYSHFVADRTGAEQSSMSLRSNLTSLTMTGRTRTLTDIFKSKAKVLHCRPPSPLASAVPSFLFFHALYKHSRCLANKTVWFGAIETEPQKPFYVLYVGQVSWQLWPPPTPWTHSSFKAATSPLLSQCLAHWELIKLQLISEKWEFE